MGLGWSSIYLCCPRPHICLLARMCLAFPGDRYRGWTSENLFRGAVNSMSGIMDQSKQAASTCGVVYVLCLVCENVRF